jgi:hypothetical protein
LLVDRNEDFVEMQLSPDWAKRCWILRQNPGGSEFAKTGGKYEAIPCCRSLRIYFKDSRLAAECLRLPAVEWAWAQACIPVREGFGPSCDKQ